LEARIESRFQDIISATKGKVEDWDVVNEPYSNDDLLKILGQEVMVKWFQRARQLDPNVKLTLNDYPSLDSDSSRHLDAFYNTIDMLTKAKAPVDTIGFQGHFGSAVVPPERVLKALDRFAKFGLPIQITEFDMDTADRDLQARYMRDFLTACFSHESVIGVTQWGFWAGRHWLPNAALWDENWNLRPHGKVFQELTQKTWTTQKTGKTNNAGNLPFRGFYGTYSATITVPGQAKVVATGKLTKTNRTLTVTLP
jgi:GH35 family endo-1,4-beta-xylanase